jgi:hypothetical protein
VLCVRETAQSEGTFFFTSTGLVQEGKYTSTAGWTGGAVIEAQPVL